MAILPIRTYPDPILKIPSRRVEQLTPAIRRLIHDLIETMHYYPRCVGLAAPQVGQPLSVAVIDTRHHPKTKRSSGLVVFLNPGIMAQEGLAIQREGCLSMPDLTANVERAVRVQVKSLDASGRSFTRWFEGFESIVVQHELDHLAGALFLDRIANVRTDVFRRTSYAFPQGEKPGK